MRQPFIKLTYDNIDITKDITSFLEEFNYSDFASGSADQIDIRLENREGYWNAGWFPSKGATLSAILGYKDDKSVNCGKFEIDEVEYRCCPEEIAIKAVSHFIDKDFRLQKNSKIYENTTLKDIVSEIASKHGFNMFFDSDDNPEIKKISQKQESDLSFLKRVCDKENKRLKVSETKIIVYDASKYDSMPSVDNIEKGKSDILSFSFSTKAHDIYKACEVRYFDPEKKVLHKYVFEDPNVHTGYTLKVNKKVNSIEEAKKLAKAELRKKNENEITAYFEIMGNPYLLSGVCIDLIGFGVFDGKYFIKQADHRYSNAGYTTHLTLRKTLCY